MEVGTKSVLIGAHQIFWHPFTVLLAWHELYGSWPNWKEVVCIAIHDLGYIGKRNMEGGPTQLPSGEYDYTEGFYHPTAAALFASWWLDEDPVLEWSLGGYDPDSNDCFKRDPYYQDVKCIKKADNRYSNLCLFHSRSTAAQHGVEPSKLCWADKLCVIFDPWWLYLPRVRLSGELQEYRIEADKAGLFPLSGSDREWYEWAKKRMIRKAYAQDARPAYTEGS